MADTTQYTADSMRELTGLEPIRQSPSQYIGDTLAVSAKNGRNNAQEDEVLTAGGFHLFVETLGNSSDEATNTDEKGKPFANLIEVRLHADQSITVTDNGRGVPPDINKETGKSGLEMTWLTMNAGGKFKSKTEKKAGNYKTAQGLHGVGAACVAALSDRLDVTVWRNGKEYRMSAKEGIPGKFSGDSIRSKFTPITDSSKIVSIGADTRKAGDKLGETGTRVHWHPDPKIWAGTDIPVFDIYEYVEAQSYMAPSCTYRIIDETGVRGGSASKPKVTEYHHPNGISDMIDEKTSKGTNLSPRISFDVPSSYTKNVVIENDDGTMGTKPIDYNCTVKVAMRWTGRNGSDIEGYANGVHCIGKHVDGLRRGLSRGVGDWIKSAHLMTKQDEKKKIVPNIDDITDGMVAVVEVLLEDQCDFHGQTKDVLGNPEVLSCVSDAVKDKVTEWFNTRKNTSTAKKIGKSILENARLRAKQKAERESAKKAKSALSSSKPAKLYDCKLSGKGTEILLCEGDSALGGMKAIRRSDYVSLLPFRGVTANVWDQRTSSNELLKHKELADLVNAMNCGIGQNFVFENRKYDRIGIYTDADNDGDYIRSLLILFIATQFPGMIENKKVFAGCPPLYSITYLSGSKKGQTEFVANEDERDAVIEDYIKQGGDVSKDKIKIQRSKGLGEMSPSELKSFLDPETRRVRIITLDDVDEARNRANDVFDLLFSRKKDAKDARRAWIDETFSNDGNDELVDIDFDELEKSTKKHTSHKKAKKIDEKERNWEIDYADGGYEEKSIDSEILNSMRSYIDYTLTDRALPYIDGMKPVHRAAIWYMWDHKIKSTSNYVKSQSIAGGVIGTLHPHSADAAYGATAGLTRDKADDTKCGACMLNLSLVDGHGNFGASFEDTCAAPRYTEMRLSKNGELCVSETDDGAVFMNLSFDVKTKLPEILPSKIPALLINGAVGLAYGYNVSWLPHNPSEAIKACILRIDNPNCSVADIKKVMPGPDFPSGGIVVDSTCDAISQAYKTGFGTLTLTSRYTINKLTRGRHAIDIYETPYGVARSGDKSIVAGISAFADDHPEYGITDVKNLSGNEHECLIEVTVKSGINADAVAKALIDPSSKTLLTQSTSYRQSAIIGDFERTDQPDATGRTNMLRLANAKPADLSLLEYIDDFIAFRKACIINSSEFKRNKALHQKHLVDGMLKALADIDEVISIVRRSQNKDTAAKNLKKRFKIDDEQAAYILSIPLARLTRSDKIQLEDNSKKLNAQAKKYDKILSSDANIKAEIKSQLTEILEQQCLPRRTTIVSSNGKIIARAKSDKKDTVALTTQTALTALGKANTASVTSTVTSDSSDSPAAPSQPSLTVSGTTTVYLNAAGELCQSTKKQQMPVQTLPDVDLNDTILIVYRDGSSTRLRAHELPSGKYAKVVKAAAGVASFGPDESHRVDVAMITTDGKVKVLDSSTLTKSPDCDVMKVASGASIAAARPATGDQSFVFVTSAANLLRFKVSTVNKQGRTSAGVAGVKLGKDVSVVFATVIDVDAASVVTSTGASIKVSAVHDFPEKGRGTLGVRCHRFVKGESRLTDAYVGVSPVAKSGTKSFELPKPAARDASGTKTDGLDGLRFGEK